jgi:hypothetical protein
MALHRTPLQLSLLSSPLHVPCCTTTCLRSSIHMSSLLCLSSPQYPHGGEVNGPKPLPNLMERPREVCSVTCTSAQGGHRRVVTALTAAAALQC